jgi:hypothetical protein
MGICRLSCGGANPLSGMLWSSTDTVNSKCTSLMILPTLPERAGIHYKRSGRRLCIAGS